MFPGQEHPAPVDRVAQQSLGTDELGGGRADRCGAQAGDQLDVLHDADESEPEHEERAEPRKPPRDACHE